MTRAAAASPLSGDPSVSRSAEGVAERPSEDELVRSALPLVGHLVRSLLGRVPAHVSRDELVSAGMLALAQAARSFDPARGVSFTGYASTRIRGALLDELRSLDWASRSVRRRAREVDDARGELAVVLGRPASDAEVASSLGIAVSELAAHHDDVSRAAVLSLEGYQEASRGDVLPSGGPTPEDVLEKRERIAYLHDAVEQLPERLRAVVEGYFFAERPMAEIAAELGVTDSRISQLRAEAVTLLRGALTSALEPQAAERREPPSGCAARRKEAYYASVAAHRSYTARLAPRRGEPFSA